MTIGSPVRSLVGAAKQRERENDAERLAVLKLMISPT